MQLILNTFGTYLSRQRQLLEVRLPDGHKQGFLPAQIDIIFIAKGVTCTSDALVFALQHDIDVVFIKHSGEALGRIWNSRFGSVATIRRQQLRFSESSVGWEWVKAQVLRKIQHQLSFASQIRYSLEVMAAEHFNFKPLDTLLRRIERVRQQVEGAEVGRKGFEASLRGWEGTASKHYFSFIAQTLPPFYAFEKRSRRPAQDIFNCLLNYMYGILYARVESALVRAGIDPFIGIWHADEYNKPVLSYDFIEPYRDWADRIAFRLCQSYSVGEEDTRAYKGGVWLAGSGKRVVIMAFNEYLNEIILQNNKHRARSTHLQLEAQALAQKILNL